MKKIQKNSKNISIENLNINKLDKNQLSSLTGGCSWSLNLNKIIIGIINPDVNL